MPRRKKNSTKPVALAKVNNPAIQQLLDNFPEELKSSIEITPDQLSLIERHLSDNRTLGLKFRLPMKCKASRCPFASVCVYQQAGIAPKGYGCPEEMIIIDKLVPTIVKDLQVDPENAIELDMITEYVDASLQEIRAQKELSIRGMVHEGVTAVNQRTGEAYTEIKESPLLMVKERAQKRKEKIRRDFLATREQRARYMVKDTDDESKRQAHLRRRMEEIIESRHIEIPEITEAQDADETSEESK